MSGGQSPIRNGVVVIVTTAVCIVVQQFIVPISSVLPPLLVRFVLGWGLALTVGALCVFLLTGSRPLRFGLMLCVPLGWLMWYLIIVGVESGARGALSLYVLYSTGFMIVGFILAEWFEHMRRLSRQR